jgi:hypothetical protein
MRLNLLQFPVFYFSVEAAFAAGVAGNGFCHFDEIEQAVLFAIDAGFDEMERLAGGFAFDP